VWATTPRSGDANQAVVPGVLYAFNAETLALLWSSTGANDDALNFAKGAPPVVANGRIYVASLSNVVSVYGLRSAAPPQQNLALAKPATGSAACAANEGPDRAVNGTTSGGNADKWCSTAAGTKFLQVDLGSSMSVGQIVIEHAGAGGESFDFNTKDYNVQVSADGSTFTTVATLTGNIQSITTHNIPATNARYVRLNVVTPTQTTDGAARIYELAVYASRGITSPPPTIDPSAWYTVVNQTSGLCADAAGVGTTNGTSVQQWTCVAGAQNQQWQFRPTDGGFYNVVPRHASALSWDVTGGTGATGNSVKVELWTAGGSAATNQQWMPVALDGAMFKFIARHSGRCLDVPGASTNTGVQLQQYECNGTGAQAFAIAAQP
jgi:hypothetical protein